MEFTDDEGNPVHGEPLETPAYTFKTENGDEYYGPLSAIQLFKLVDV